MTLLKRIAKIGVDSSILVNPKNTTYEIDLGYQIVTITTNIDYDNYFAYIYIQLDKVPYLIERYEGNTNNIVNDKIEILIPKEENNFIIKHNAHQEFINFPEKTKIVKQPENNTELQIDLGNRCLSIRFLIDYLDNVATIDLQLENYDEKLIDYNDNTLDAISININQNYNRILSINHDSNITFTGSFEDLQQNINFIEDKIKELKKPLRDISYYKKELAKLKKKNKLM